jgi:hypothetical protein
MKFSWRRKRSNGDDSAQEHFSVTFHGKRVIKYEERQMVMEIPKKRGKVCSNNKPHTKATELLFCKQKQALL